jgi:hypothetical protein
VLEKGGGERYEPPGGSSHATPNTSSRKTTDTTTFYIKTSVGIRIRESFAIHKAHTLFFPLKKKEIFHLCVREVEGHTPKT